MAWRPPVIAIVGGEKMMTSEVIVSLTPTASPIPVHDGMDFTTVLLDPSPIPYLVFILALMLAPVSVVVFVRCWRSMRRGGTITWQPAFCKLAALAIATTTIIHICQSLSIALYYPTAPHAWGADQNALLRTAIAYASQNVAIGVFCASLCLALAIGIGMIQMKTANQAMHQRPSAGK